MSTSGASPGAKYAMVYEMLVFPEDDQFVSRCPQLELSSCGDSVQEAFDNLEEAIEVYLDTIENLLDLEEWEQTLSEKGIELRKVDESSGQEAEQFSVISASRQVQRLTTPAGSGA